MTSLKLLASLLLKALSTYLVLGHLTSLFPNRAEIYLAGIEDSVEILMSLQLPKKITLRGSDGKLYIMMCKPKVAKFTKSIWPPRHHLIDAIVLGYTTMTF